MVAVKLRQLRLFGLIVVASSAMVISACQTSEITKNCVGDADCPGCARVCEKPTVRALAHDLDALESHIERYGSVVIQHPSVWGQARLTKHREEFEKIMHQDLCNFKQTLQGALSRSDQAYFMNSLALGVAVSGPQATYTPTTVNSSSSSSAAAPAVIPIPTPDPIAPAPFDRNAARLPAAIGFSGLTQQGISTEPSVYLNQKARYLNHLHELRRINEGDDTGDSPGYALNLIRVPVSLLPGKHTQEGHGAEVTMTLKPHLSDELLPTTFRNLVVNDLLEHIGVPLTQFLNDREQLENFSIVEKVKKSEAGNKNVPAVKARNVPQLNYVSLPIATQQDGPKEGKKPRTFVPYGQLRDTSKALLASDPAFQQRVNVVKMAAQTAPIPKLLPPGKAEEQAYEQVWQNRKIDVPQFTATKLRHARRPFPPSQILDIYGSSEGFNVAKTAFDMFQRDPSNKYWIHYPDVQGYLQEELAASYRFLADPEHLKLWKHCNQELVNAIHTRKVDKVETLRDRFSDQVLATTKRDIDEDVTVVLAWAIIVESALLNQQLIDDIKESAAAKNCPRPITVGHGDDCWLEFFLPQPGQPARDAFKSYVECRWPIIVFALDPVAEQQNIGDSFSSRREMQLALSMAFVSGNISAKNMTQYARRLELEAETVALNNTVVGFSHGNETFGWRFYPRFQTPDTESNFTVFFRDQLIGGPNRNALLRQRKLDPGQRECIAVVVMPSFVPYATLETSSSWFKLTNPKCKDMTCVDAVKLSARVKAIENCSPNVIDADCYRDGELGRLMARAKQLEARLPLQSATVQIPYENTLGGFAMFNTGITDLAPELYGWYGAPGIDTADTTSLFLIGNHFSVHQTRVVVGGIILTDTEMLSRQVMRVTIPKGALTIERTSGKLTADCPDPCPASPTPAAKNATANGEENNIALASFGAPIPAGGSAAKDLKAAKDPKPATEPCTARVCKELFVDVHIATPYGVTGHLLIPACNIGPEKLRPGAMTPDALNCPTGAPPAAAKPVTPEAKGVDPNPKLLVPKADPKPDPKADPKGAPGKDVKKDPTKTTASTSHPASKGAGQACEPNPDRLPPALNHATFVIGAAPLLAAQPKLVERGSERHLPGFLSL